MSATLYSSLSTENPVSDEIAIEHEEKTEKEGKMVELFYDIMKLTEKIYNMSKPPDTGDAYSEKTSYNKEIEKTKGEVIGKCCLLQTTADSYYYFEGGEYNTLISSARAYLDLAKDIVEKVYSEFDILATGILFFHENTAAKIFNAKNKPNNIK